MMEEEQINNWKFGNPIKYPSCIFVPIKTQNFDPIRFQIGDDPITSSSLNIITIHSVDVKKQDDETTSSVPLFSHTETTASEEDKNISISFSYLNESSICSLFKWIDQHILKTAIKNSEKWFQRPKVSKEMVEDKFNSIIKRSDEMRSISRININNKNKQKPIVKIATLNETIKDGTLTDIKIGQHIMMDIHIKGLYLYQQSKNITNFGISWSLISCLIFEKKEFYSFGITIPERFKRKRKEEEKEEDEETEDEEIYCNRRKSCKYSSEEDKDDEQY